jgi:hypothetical protein
MGCYLNMDNIAIPPTLKAKVEELITKHDLEGVIEVDHTDENSFFVQLVEGSVSWDTSSVIRESFLPDVAELLKDTEYDGQAIITEVDEEPSTMLLLNGKARGYEDRLKVAECSSVAKGEFADIQLPYHVLGIGNGRVLILQ